MVGAETVRKLAQRVAPTVSRGRIQLLRLAVVLPAVVILARVMHLQWVVAPVVRARQSELAVRTRPVPATRGTIRFRDGTIAAQSRSRVVIAVHYRALERPLRNEWLKRLASQSGQGPEQLREQLLGLLPALAELTGTPLPQLEARASAIRWRVSRLREAVLARRRSTAALPEPPVEGWLHRLATLFADARPRPRRADDFVLKEETWYYPLVDLAHTRGAVELATRLSVLPAVRLEVRSTRTYPRHHLAAHAIGYVRSTGEDGTGGFEGVAGIEAEYDRVLAGTAGWLRESRRGDAPYRTAGGKAPVPGEDVRLTIDPRLQRLAERLLADVCRSGQARSGAVVLMHAASGRLLVAASWPGYDPNVAVSGGSAWRRLVRDRRAPLMARYSQMILPPGSVFKPIVAVAALESGVVTADEQIVCRGYYGPDPGRFRCWIAQDGGAHGPLTVEAALAQSCNVVFYELAVRLGPERLLRVARQFGLGTPTGIDLPGERSGKLPAFGPAGGNPPVELLNCAIGQGTLLVTPVQVARWTAALINGGYLVRPSVTGRRAVLRTAVPVDHRTLSVVTAGMVRAVRSPRGTAHRALGGAAVPLGAKTGTAEVGPGRVPHAWCVAFFPVERPRWVVVVCLEHGGHGGETAAGLVKQMAEAAMPRLVSLPP